VAGEEHAAAFLLFGQQPARQPATAGLVEPLLGLVEQREHPGPGEAGRQRQPSPLPAGQADRELVGRVGQADLGQQVGRVLIGRVVAVRRHQQRQVLGNGQVGEELHVVEDRRDGPPGLEVAFPHRPPAQPDGPGRGPVSPGDTPQQRALARAVRADHRDRLTRADLRVDAGENIDFAERAAQPGDGEQRRGPLGHWMGRHDAPL